MLVCDGTVTLSCVDDDGNEPNTPLPLQSGHFVRFNARRAASRVSVDASAVLFRALDDDDDDESLLTQTPPNERPEQLIPELCRQFYRLGWVTGTGGGCVSTRR